MSASAARPPPGSGRDLGHRPPNLGNRGAAGPGTQKISVAGPASARAGSTLRLVGRLPADVDPGEALSAFETAVSNQMHRLAKAAAPPPPIAGAARLMMAHKGGQPYPYAVCIETRLADDALTRLRSLTGPGTILELAEPWCGAVGVYPNVPDRRRPALVRGVPVGMLPSALGTVLPQAGIAGATDFETRFHPTTGLELGDTVYFSVPATSRLPTAPIVITFEGREYHLRVQPLSELPPPPLLPGLQRVEPAQRAQQAVRARAPAATGQQAAHARQPSAAAPAQEQPAAAAAGRTYAAALTGQPPPAGGQPAKQAAAPAGGENVVQEPALPTSAADAGAGTGLEAREPLPAGAGAPAQQTPPADGTASSSSMPAREDSWVHGAHNYPRTRGTKPRRRRRRKGAAAQAAKALLALTIKSSLKNTTHRSGAGGGAGDDAGAAVEAQTAEPAGGAGAALEPAPPSGTAGASAGARARSRQPRQHSRPNSAGRPSPSPDPKRRAVGNAFNALGDVTDMDTTAEEVAQQRAAAAAADSQHASSGASGSGC